MKYLVDTVVFLWMIFGEEEKLSQKVVRLLQENPHLHFSVVSAWEIAIKYSIGKLELRNNPKDWLPDIILKMGFEQIPVYQAHALEVASLPRHHNDPFDRLLICQAKLENLSIISPDKIFNEYPVRTIW